MSIYIDGKLVAGVKSRGSIPAGCIIGYNGELNNIPLGYALCNGQNGTPDLTDKFIVGDSPTKYEFCYIMKQNLPTSETAKIYGVTWDGSSTTKWKRIKDSALFPEPVPYVSGATNYGSPFDNIYPWKGMSVSGRQRYFTPEMYGLAQIWDGVCWCNPPYGREIGKWVRKAWLAAEDGATVVMLLPARTDTAWFHDYIYNRTDVEIRFLRGRLKF